MIGQFTATLINGVIVPDVPLPLPERTRVTLNVEPIPDDVDPVVIWEELKAMLRERPIHGGGLRYTRDELHERR